MPTEKQIFNKTELKLLTPEKIQTCKYADIEIFIESIIKANTGNGLPQWRRLIQALSRYQIKLISPYVIPLFTPNDLLLYAFSKKQMAAFTEKQIQAFTSEQIKHFSYNKFSLLEKGIRKVWKKLISQSTIEYDLCKFNFQIEALTPKQIQWFTAKQKKAFTPEQIKAFTSKQLKAFNMQPQRQEVIPNFNQENINAIWKAKTSFRTNNPKVTSL